MKKFQLDEVQFERLEMAKQPRPALMMEAAGDPVRDAWAQFGRDLGFDPATVANWQDDWTFDAEPITAEAAVPAPEPAAEETLPEAGEIMVEKKPESFVAMPSDGMAAAAGDLVRHKNPDVEQLAIVIRESALTVESGHELLSRFAPLAGAARGLLITSKTINVTAEDQTGNMAMARVMRLQLRDVRLRSEKMRKGLKDESLKRGKAIDGLHHVVEYLIAPEEARLEELEKFAERAAAERMRVLGLERFEALMKYGFNPGQIDLGAMAQEDFDRMLEGQKLAAEAAEKRKRDEQADKDRKAEEQRKADAAEVERKRKVKEEEDRVAREKQAAKDEELRLSKLKSDRMVELSRFGSRIETRLQGGILIHYSDEVIAEKGAIETMPNTEWMATLASAKSRFEEQQAKVKAQREKEATEKKAADDKAAAEKKRADDAQAELNRQKKAKDDAERKRKADDAKAARAPDKQKLVAYIKSLHSITAPVLKTDPGKFALEAIAEQYDLARKFAEQTIGEL